MWVCQATPASGSTKQKRKNKKNIVALASNVIAHYYKRLNPSLRKGGSIGWQPKQNICSSGNPSLTYRCTVNSVDADGAVTSHEHRLLVYGPRSEGSDRIGKTKGRTRIEYSNIGHPSSLRGYIPAIPPSCSSKIPHFLKTILALASLSFNIIRYSQPLRQSRIPKPRCHGRNNKRDGKNTACFRFDMNLCSDEYKCVRMCVVVAIPSLEW